MKIPLPNNWILTFEAKPKNNGRGEQSKIKQVLAKFGKKTISLITTILRSSEVGALMMNRIGMLNANSEFLSDHYGRLRNLCP